MGNLELRVLIYRLGSLGDTVVALPSLRLIELAYPKAQRWMLTNFNVNSKAAPMARVLDGTGLVHGYIEYPIGLRDPLALLRLCITIRRLQPDVLVYLTEFRGRLKTLRDAAFFRVCGIQRLVGVPYAETHQHPLKLADEHYEYEGARLLRCIQSMGQIDLDSKEAFDLCLNNIERDAANIALAPLAGRQSLIAASIGTKWDVNDWGDINWSALLERLGTALPSAGLVMLGAEVEHKRSEALLRYWPGAGQNLCGQLTVRESAAVLEQANLFIGHDSGPMHLAAAVGTSCVAVFSSRNLPGEWYPYGTQHRILYHSLGCQGCRLDVCQMRDKECIRSISVNMAIDAVIEVLGRNGYKISAHMHHNLIEIGHN